MRDRFDQRQERKLDTTPDSHVALAPSLGAVTGAGRRREWPAADKTRIIVESLTPGANVSDVARRNGLSPQQLFGWRREARELFEQDCGETRAAQATAPTTHGVAMSKARVATPTFVPPTFVPPTFVPPAFVPPAFVPIVVATSASVPGSDAVDTAQRVTCRTGATDVIEIVIGDCVVRVSGRVDAHALQTVVELVRRVACS